MIELEIDEQKIDGASIKVFGIGGAGGNTVNSIIESGYQGIEFVVANTDAQALNLSKASQKIQLGVKLTKGLGTGANPDLGKRAAEEDLDKIMEVVGNSDIIFLTAGLGGGTGSGALPIIARALKERGILSVVVVTKPFLFEGKRRAIIAQEALEILRKEVDTLIVIPNQKLLEVTDKNISMIDAFAIINNILSQSVKGVSDIITKPGYINVDFADVKTIMKDMGLAVMGTGKASGEDRAKQAALNAISSPLLENINVTGAHGVIMNITGGRNLGLHEISNAVSVIYDQVGEDANIIFGSVIDESFDEEISVTIIVTGFKQGERNVTAQSHKEVHVKGTILDTSEVTQYDHAPEHEGSQDSMQEEVVQEAHQEETVTSNEEKQEALIDIENLDIPTFLRNKIADEKSENS